MTPNRLTYIEISVSLTVGVLLFHLYKNNCTIKIKRTELDCPVLLYVKLVNRILIRLYPFEQVHQLYEFLPKVQMQP